MNDNNPPFFIPDQKSSFGDDVNNYNDYLERIKKQQINQELMLRRLEVIEIQNTIEHLREDAIEKYLKNSRLSGFFALVNTVQSTFKSSPKSSSSQAKQNILHKLLTLECKLASTYFEVDDSSTHYFHYQDQEWYWYSHSSNSNDTANSVLVRYFVDERRGLFKSYNGGEFQLSSELEHDRFTSAAKAYFGAISNNLYNSTKII